MRCPQCGLELEEPSAFCPDCGARLDKQTPEPVSGTQPGEEPGADGPETPTEELQCPDCGQGLEEPGAFCPHCGAARDGSAPPQQPQATQRTHEALPPLAPLGSPESLPQDLADYVGPRADYYLPRFKKFHKAGDDFKLSWNWWAFWGGLWWSLYRKMYLWTGVYFALGFLLSFAGRLVETAFSPLSGVLLMLALLLAYLITSGLVGNQLYYRQARRQIADVARLYKTQDQRTVLAQRGGVHRWVIWVALVFMVGFPLLTILVIIIALVAASNGG